jgi:Flp pilus assembly protein TadB
MAKYEQLFNEAKKDLDNVRKELDGKISELNKDIVKKSDLQHYSTKHYVLTCGAALFVTMCSAYWYVNPIIIKSEIQQVNIKTEESNKSKNKL